MGMCSSELSIDEILRDPIILAQMKADRVAVGELETLLRSVSPRPATPPAWRCPSRLFEHRHRSAASQG